MEKAIGLEVKELSTTLHRGSSFQPRIKVDVIMFRQEEKQHCFHNNS
jgi:hypothetical protein